MSNYQGPKEDRVYIRINGDLKKAVEAYAERNNISLSDVTTRFFINLLRHEKEQAEAKKSLRRTKKPTR